MNIIANAIDAIDPSHGPGRITIATGQQNGHFVIRVRDTGKGIPEEIRGRIFEPFFTTKPIGQGTGLGLAISYGIMQAHQGSMEFSSTAGEGTEFVLKIPTSIRVPA
jgi:two-component system NtrC family sensor kinase